VAWDIRFYKNYDQIYFKISYARGTCFQFSTFILPLVKIHIVSLLFTMSYVKNLTLRSFMIINLHSFSSKVLLSKILWMGEISQLPFSSMQAKIDRWKNFYWVLGHCFTFFCHGLFFTRAFNLTQCSVLVLLKVKLMRPQNVFLHKEITLCLMLRLN